MSYIYLEEAILRQVLIPVTICYKRQIDLIAVAFDKKSDMKVGRRNLYERTISSARGRSICPGAFGSVHRRVRRVVLD
jgi:hypothetical protein